MNIQSQIKYIKWKESQAYNQFLKSLSKKFLFKIIFNADEIVTIWTRKNQVSLWTRRNKVSLWTRKNQVSLWT